MLSSTGLEENLFFFQSCPGHHLVGDVLQQAVHVHHRPFTSTSGIRSERCHLTLPFGVSGPKKYVLLSGPRKPQASNETEESVFSSGR